MTLHIEPIYGMYHGQDPRTFIPDEECCTVKEIQVHAKAIIDATNGTWEHTNDHSGCHMIRGAIVCLSSFGIGVYHVVMNSDGEYLRDASFSDCSHEGEWEESQ